MARKSPEKKKVYFQCDFVKSADVSGSDVLQNASDCQIAHVSDRGMMII